MCEIAIIPFLNQKKIYLHTIKKTVSIVCALRFQQLLANKHCVMQSLAEWKNESANVHDEKKKKQRVNLEPPRPMAARLTTNPPPPRTQKGAKTLSSPHQCPILPRGGSVGVSIDRCITGRRNQPRSQGTLSTSRKYPGYGWSRVC